MQRTNILSKPIRAVLRWQLIATALLALVAGLLAGTPGAMSAVLGGAVSVVAGAAAAVVAAKGRGKSAGGVLIGALLAEGVKLGLIVILALLVLTAYDGAVVPVFVGALVVTALLFSMAFFVRDY